MALEEISIPVNKAVMEEAEKIFQQNGLTIETAINMYLKKVADADGMQFVLGLIKEEQEYNKSLEQQDDYMTEAFKASVNEAIAVTKMRGNPVARYDFETQMPYMEYPDGHREYR